MIKTKKIPKILSLLLAALMLLSATPITARAAGVNSVIDKNETGSITLYKKDKTNQTAIEGVGYTLYRVAEINQATDNNVSVTTFDELYASTINSIAMPEINNINSANSQLFTNTVVAELNGVAVASTAGYADTDVVKYAEIRSNTNGEIIFSNLKAGYVYLAIETTTPNGVSRANNFLITVPTYVAEYADGSGETVAAYWEYDVVAEPKNDIDSSVVKEAYVKDANGNYKSVDSVEYGSTVTYEIKANIPTNIYPYDDGNGNIKYYNSYLITDSAGKNIEYVLDYSGGTATVPATIEVWNDSTGTAMNRDVLTLGIDYVLSYVPATDTKDAHFTVELMNTSLDFSMVAAGDITTLYNRFNEGDYLVITYDAKIVDNDKSTAADTKNTVTVSTDGTEGELKLTEEEKEIETYDYRVWKVGKDTTDSGNDYVGLKDAEFALQNASGEYMALREYEEDGKTKYEWITYAATTTATSKEEWENAVASLGKLTKTFKSDQYGILTIAGLAEGTYQLLEVSAPDGYTLLANTVKITVDADSDKLALTDLIVSASSDSESDVNNLLNSASGTDYYSVKIVNKSDGSKDTGEWVLPQTGDMGIGIFIGIGSLLILAAVGLYAYNKKRNSSNRA